MYHNKRDECQCRNHDCPEHEGYIYCMLPHEQTVAYVDDSDNRVRMCIACATEAIESGRYEEV